MSETTPGRAVRPEIRQARAVRKAPSSAQAALWAALRGHRLEGWKFRRQHPCGWFLVDFYCHAARLAVRLHGGEPADPLDVWEHADQTWWLELVLGVRTLWVRDAEVADDLGGVLRRIAETAQQPEAGWQFVPPEVACAGGLVIGVDGEPS